jgi:CheY-like chemotaxis protein
MSWTSAFIVPSPTAGRPGQPFDASDRRRARTWGSTLIHPAEAGDGLEALRRAEELLPEMILMDVRVPKQSRIDARLAITG